MLAELEEIAGENDYIPLGQVPREWCNQRAMGTCLAQGSYADIYAIHWVGHLRQVLASECLKLGLEDLDVAVLQQGKPRRLTQFAALEVYRTGMNGIYYAGNLPRIWKQSIKDPSQEPAKCFFR